MGRHYTAEMLEWLRQAYRVDRLVDLLPRWNRRWGRSDGLVTLKSILYRHGISSGRPPGLRPGEAREGQMSRVYTDAELDWLRTHRAQYPRPALAAAFAARFGRVVGPDALAQVCIKRGYRAGGSGCFVRGTRPWNAGRTGQPMHPSTIAAQFPPGNQPHTWLPVGTYAQDGYGRWKVKVSDSTGDPTRLARRDWRYVTRLTYQDYVGPIPPGGCILLLDTDEYHCMDPDNLICVSRAVLARLNQTGYSTLPLDRALRRAAVAAAVLVDSAHTAARRAGLSARARRQLIGGGGPFPALTAAAAALVREPVAI